MCISDFALKNEFIFLSMILPNVSPGRASQLASYETVCASWLMDVVSFSEAKTVREPAKTPHNKASDNAAIIVIILFNMLLTFFKSLVYSRRSIQIT